MVADHRSGDIETEAASSMLFARTSGSPTGLQESAQHYFRQDCRGIPGIRQKGPEVVLVLASMGGMLERMAGDSAASKVNLRAESLRARSLRAGEDHGVAAGLEGASAPTERPPAGLAVFFRAAM